MTSYGTSRGLLALLALGLLAAPALAQPALRERMLLAEDQRAAGDAELAPLREGIASRDPATRRQAVRAIGRLERPELMPLISRLLTDPNHDVRIEAINAIGQLGRGPQGVAGAKSRLLARVKGEQTPRVRGVAAATLGRLPFTAAADVEEAERAIAALVPVMASVGNLDEIAGAVEGLEALIRQSAKLSPPGADTVARLKGVAAIGGRDQDKDILARIRRLARQALTAANAVDRPLLESGIRDADDEVRRITMLSARAAIDGRDTVIKAGLVDREPRVRYEALQTWGRAFQKQACGPLYAAVRDENAHVVLLAIDLLGNGCPAADRAPAAVLGPIAQTLAVSRTWHAPAHALVSLAKVDPAEAAKLFSAYLAHPVWQVRMYAARAAGAAKDVDALAKLGRDRHDNVREAALAELIALKHSDAEYVALEALRRPDYQLVMTAARALAAPANRDRAIAALTAAHARIVADRRDTSRDAREAITARLEALGADVSAMKHVPRLPAPPVRLADVDALRDVHLRVVMEGKGAFDLKLLVDDAPLTALRVATRAKEGYYNGLTFHRVVPNFVIQGGSPGANEYAGDAPYMRDEVGLVPHRRGAVGISTRGRDTGDAQIFINLVDLPRLEHTYTVFAEVVAGMDVVDSILEGDVIERVEIR